MFKRLLSCYCCLFSPKLERCWLGSAHADFAHSVSSMSCEELLLVVFYLFCHHIGGRLFDDRAYAELACTRIILLEANVCRDVPVCRHVTDLFCFKASRQPALQWRKLGRAGCLRGRVARYVAAAALWLVAACGCCLAMLLPLTTPLGVSAAVLLPSFLRCVQLRHVHGLLRQETLLLEFMQRVPYYTARESKTMLTSQCLGFM